MVEHSLADLAKLDMSIQNLINDFLSHNVLNKEDFENLSILKEKKDLILSGIEKIKSFQEHIALIASNIKHEYTCIIQLIKDSKPSSQSQRITRSPSPPLLRAMTEKDWFYKNTFDFVYHDPDQDDDLENESINSYLENHEPSCQTSEEQNILTCSSPATPSANNFPLTPPPPLTTPFTPVHLSASTSKSAIQPPVSAKMSRERFIDTCKSWGLPHFVTLYASNISLDSDSSSVPPLEEFYGKSNTQEYQKTSGGGGRRSLLTSWKEYQENLSDKSYHNSLCNVTSDEFKISSSPLPLLVIPPSYSPISLETNFPSTSPPTSPVLHTASSSDSTHLKMEKCFTSDPLQEQTILPKDLPETPRENNQVTPSPELSPESMKLQIDDLHSKITLIMKTLNTQLALSQTSHSVEPVSTSSLPSLGTSDGSQMPMDFNPLLPPPATRNPETGKRRFLLPTPSIGVSLTSPGERPFMLPDPVKVPRKEKRINSNYNASKRRSPRHPNTSKNNQSSSPQIKTSTKAYSIPIPTSEISSTNHSALLDKIVAAAIPYITNAVQAAISSDTSATQVISSHFPPISETKQDKIITIEN